MKQDTSAALDILLISDSTGETVTAAMKATISQFPGVEARYRLFPFVQNREGLDAIDDVYFSRARLAAFTVVDPTLKSRIGDRCSVHDLPYVSVIDPLVDWVSLILKLSPSTRPGQQYLVDRDYLDRVSAIDFAISNDDGQTEDYLLSADVILIGVSRTSKTPTCIYLGYQGIKAANVPLIRNKPEPPELLTAINAGVPVIGLTVSPTRLTQVRRTRLRTLGSPSETEYSDARQIEEELTQARLLFDKYGLPVIDVTRRSIEETAAAIRHHLDLVNK